MSDTLVNVRTRVLTLLRSTSPNNTIVDPMEVDDEINRALQDLALEGIVGKTWTDSYVTLAADDYEYTLSTSGSSEYGAILAVRRHSDGYPLSKRTPQALEEMYNRQSPERGAPDDYSLAEQTDQSVTIRIGPAPQSGTTETLDVMFEKLPGRVASDSDTIGLTRAGLGALELMAAAYVCDKLPESELARANLSVNASQSFMRRAQSLKAAVLAVHSGFSVPNEIQRFEA